MRIGDSFGEVRRLAVAQHLLQAPVPAWMVAVAEMVRVRPDWVRVKAAVKALSLGPTRTAIWHHIDPAAHEPELGEGMHGVLPYVTVQLWVTATPLALWTAQEVVYVPEVFSGLKLTSMTV